MNIDELTLGQLKEVHRMCGAPTPKSHSFEIGKCYFIRTVTNYITGRCASVTDTDVRMDDAAWVADTGRFSDALLSGNLNEVEPYPSAAYVSRGSIVDFCEWPHALPRSKK